MRDRAQNSVMRVQELRSVVCLTFFQRKLIGNSPHHQSLKHRIVTNSQIKNLTILDCKSINFS